jgi:hypothetical protein
MKVGLFIPCYIDALATSSARRPSSSRLVFGVASLPLVNPVALEVILEIKGA